LNRYTENYKQSLRNVSEAGVDIFCYNFMPLVDWTRTDLEFDWGDGSRALKFDLIAFAAFDLFILGRKDADKDYTEKQIKVGHRKVTCKETYVASVRLPFSGPYFSHQN
jgi:mannonate dehydratase